MTQAGARENLDIAGSGLVLFWSMGSWFLRYQVLAKGHDDRYPTDPDPQSIIAWLVMVGGAAAVMLVLTGLRYRLRASRIVGAIALASSLLMLALQGR